MVALGGNGLAPNSVCAIPGKMQLSVVVWSPSDLPRTSRHDLRELAAWSSVRSPQQVPGQMAKPNTRLSQSPDTHVHRAPSSSAA